MFLFFKFNKLLILSILLALRIWGLLVMQYALPRYIHLFFVCVTVFIVSSESLFSKEFLFADNSSRKVDDINLEPEDHTVRLEQLGILDKVGAWMENTTTNIFTWWGTIAAKYPLPVIGQ